MDKIVIGGGLTRTPVHNRYGEQIGVAVYDLDDVQVRSNLVGCYDELKEISNKYQPIADELKKDDSEDENGFPANVKALSELDLQCVNEMIEKIDGVFGAEFCEHAVGQTKNPLVILELVGAIVEKYENESEKEINKYTNREQRRAASKK